MALWWRSLHRKALGRRFGVWLPLIAAVALDTEAVALDPSAPTKSGRETWSGADVSSNVWLMYSGVTLAPWSGMHDPGLRFRAAGGYGGYAYDKAPDRPPEDPRSVRFQATPRPTHHEAQTYFADVLAGYLTRWGELTAKAFIGASIISHQIAPFDEETIAFGEEIGAKGVIELWLNLGEHGWGSLDLSWASAHNTRTARSRLGYRVWPKLSMGVEAGLNLDAQGECRIKGPATSGCNLLAETEAELAELADYARGGIFARFEWGSSEASISAGVLGDSLGDESTEVSPYLTVNWLSQF